ncbi:MAG: putative toxin-antitoxin system toxin component, PIN family [Rubrobacter sp.]
MSPARVVLDTNVVVSALLNSFGAPGRVLDLALAGELTVVHDDRILAEWRQVLAREKFGFSARDVAALLGFVQEVGLGVNPSPLGAELPDPDDVVFLEAASAAEATLITGNTKHYPPEKRRGVVVLDPATFLEGWTSNIQERERANQPESTGDDPSTTHW